MSERNVIEIRPSVPTLEGAGVRLRRAFGFGNTSLTDPFLLLDDFRGDSPSDYLKGFPWHPHRGIETITYVLKGDVEHGDSIGNKGDIGAGDVQWMTAGSGIVHQEMPRGDAEGRMWGFQLWANLPASMKMMEPRYRDIKAADIPEVELEGGVRIKVICGQAGGATGPAKDIVIEPEYLDISVPSGSSYSHAVAKGHNVLAYVFEGGGSFGQQMAEATNRDLVLFGDGDKVSLAAGEGGVRLLLISGKPLGEPVAWQGPIVMNTEEELELAFEEYRNGTFLKHGSQPG